ncbi:hypothetical protein [Paenibacillus protaetiae]|uniref:Extracellular solute-binding protein n=1 Tax=Paenibacillus protaetiae TaxID=2509456 RepID=A0A4P6ES72_9BACL|nr:hypothetical protein [Paenibacillus protaetiae]QAY65406.1 hypothetical protein ET464_02425 [Paenibacillus protaetiae]
MEEPVNVSVTVSMTYAEFEGLKQYTDTFMTQYPNITVSLSNDTEASEAKWMDEAELGSGPDVMLLNSSSVGRFAGRGLLKPAETPGMSEAGSEQAEALVEPLKWNGYTWGTPKDADPYIWVWSASLLSSLGSAQPPDDWESYKLLMEEWIKQDDGVPYIYLSGGDAGQSAAWLGAFAQDAAQGQASPAGGQLRQQEEAALSWLQANWSGVQTQGLDSGVQRLGALLQDKLLSAFVPWSVYLQLSASERSKLIVDKGPVREPWLDARSFVISSHSKVPEEAAKWIEEMTGLNSQLEAYRMYGKLPSVKALYMTASSGGSITEYPPNWLLQQLQYVPRNRKQTSHWLFIPMNGTIIGSSLQRKWQNSRIQAHNVMPRSGYNKQTRRLRRVFMRLERRKRRFFWFYFGDGLSQT